MLKRLAGIGAAQDGVIAVEFALIVPVLILMFFGAFEVARAVDCRSRVVQASATVADLVAQSSSISSSDAQKILCAAKGVIYPYATSGTVKLTISSIVCKTYSTASGCTAMSIATSDGAWSIYNTGSSARMAVPSGVTASMFPASGSGVVMVEMTYTYTSPLAMVLSKTMAMHATSYSLPRALTAVTYSGSASTISDCSI